MSSKYFLYFIFFIIISEANSLRKLKEEDSNDDIIILHTNDVHCGIDDIIGYDGLMLYKKELMVDHKHVLVVDAGDHIQGGTIGLISKGSDIIDIMNYVGYDAVALGNHEFDYKLEQLNNLTNRTNTKYICANFCYRKNKTTVFDPYKIIDVGEKKIGFIGVLTPQALTKSYLHSLVDEEGNLIYDLLTEDDGLELANRIQSYIELLRKEKGVSYVILLAHLGYGGDALEQYTSRGLLSNLEGVDAIIDGHTHLVYNELHKDKNGKGVYIAQAGTKLQSLGKITISSDGKITSEMIDEIPYSEDFPDAYTIERQGKNRYVDGNTYQFLQNIIESHAHEFEEVIGFSDFDLNITKDNIAGIRLEENTLGDLVTDAVRYYGEADIAMMNAGSIRDNLKKGNITYNHILNILPFSSRIIVKEVSGQDILNALEFGMRLLPNRTSRFPQVSGIKFKVDETIKSPVVIDQDENFEKVEGERRVYDVYVGEEKISENKIYKISFDEYLADGGDGYSMFSKYNMTSDTLLADNEVFKKYIIEVLDRTIPDIYKSTQGRIVKKAKGENSSNFIKYCKGIYLLVLCLML